MADISKITIPSGSTYNLKDATARSSLSNKQDKITAITAQTTQAVYPIKIDSQGHITAYGSAVTSMAPTAHTHSANDLNGGYINIHPENGPVLIPFMHNDLAFLLKRGGSASVTKDGTTISTDLSNCFDGTGSYWSISPSGVTTFVIILTLHTTFGWTNTIYVDFGASAWRSNSVKIEVMNSSYASDTWTQKYNNTANTLGHVYVTTSHTPVGASNAGAGFNKIRLTFSSFNSGFRIAQIGVYNYGSYGLRQPYMSRGADDYVFRDITPNNNNTYSLGSSSLKWSNVYANAYNLATTTVGSASAGTAIAADDITKWTTNTPTAVTKKTVVTSASGATAAYANGVLTLTNGSFGTGDSVTVTAGTAATLEYTARSIPNISVSNKTVATGETT